MVKNVKSEEIKYKEEKQKSDIENSVSELEDLLGQKYGRKIFFENKKRILGIKVEYICSKKGILWKNLKKLELRFQKNYIKS